MGYETSSASFKIKVNVMLSKLLKKYIEWAEKCMHKMLRSQHQIGLNQKATQRGAMLCSDGCYLPTLLSTVLAPEAGECAVPECEMQHYDRRRHSQH